MVLTDDSGNQHNANLTREDLESEQRFVFKFVRDANLAPVLKDEYRGPHFIRLWPSSSVQARRHRSRSPTAVDMVAANELAKRPTCSWTA